MAHYSRLGATALDVPEADPGDRSGQQPGKQAAEVEATLAVHRKWVADGRPGAISHEEAMAELLRGDQRA